MAAGVEDVRRHLRSASKRLTDELERQILPDGGHISRNPGALVALLAELGLPTQRRYEVFSMEVNKAWDWNRREGGEPGRGNQYATTSGDLARALRRNPHLRVLVASGHYDLGTPYAATDWSLAQLDAPADVLTRVEHHYYDAGHMMYTREADLKKLKSDLAHWLSA